MPGPRDVQDFLLCRCRDSGRRQLLRAGCRDPADRVSETKERDGRRQAVADLFAVWWERHHELPIAIRDLHDDVRQAADPQGRGRQYLSSRLEKLDGTRMAGFVLTRQPAAGRWGAATYALGKTDRQEGHRDHRGHRAEESPRDHPETPCAPDADERDSRNCDDSGADYGPKAPMSYRSVRNHTVIHGSTALAGRRGTRIASSRRLKR